MWTRRNALSATAQLVVVLFASLITVRLGLLETLHDIMGDYVIPLLVISVIAGGWPWAPPMGPMGRPRGIMGAASTLLWLGLSAIYIIVHHLVGLNDFSSIASLYLALAWGLGFEAWPMRHLEPRWALVTGTSSTLAVLVSTSIIHPSRYLYSLLLWGMAILTLASPYFVLQGYPFRRLMRQPRVGAVLVPVTLAIAAPLSLVDYESLASSIMFWSVTYSWSFAYLGIGSTQPRRGLYSLAVVIALSLGWSLGLGSLGLDVVTLNLGLALPLVVAHNSLWLRAPLTEPLLPGMPPHGQRNVEILWGMYHRASAN